MRALLAIGLLTWTLGALAAPRWHWHDRFSDQEQSGLKAWVEHALDAMQALFGEVPDRRAILVHFHRHPRGGEPVPWAQTWKGSGREVFFHVDTRYDWRAFRADWTAPHELTHLLFPYLGHDDRWFAEGIASYLQYPILYAGGMLSWDEVIERYRQRFEDAADERSSGEQSIVAQSRGGAGGSGGYGRLYWGGAAYFLHADRALHQATGLRLPEIVRRYGACCYRAWGADAADMIREFDRLSGTRVFSLAYEQTVARSGFPSTAASLEWLRNHPPLLHPTPAAEPERALRRPLDDAPAHPG